MSGPVVPCRSFTPDEEDPGGCGKCLGYSFAVVAADTGDGALVGFGLFAVALSDAVCPDTGAPSALSEVVVVTEGELGALGVLSDWSFRRLRICSHPDLSLDNSLG